jgi:RHS repeat-associated protein
MATYDYAQAPNQTMSFQLKERHIYGSTRLGMYAEPVVLIEHPSSETNNTVVNQGFKYYEMTNHLGNVLTVIHDIKIPLNNGSGPAVSSYRVGIRNSTDYSPFGVELDGRTVSLDGYRFGYQGSEKDNEFKGEGNSYTTEFRQLDPRLGRWFSIDPVAKKYPFQSPYVSVDNNPLYLADSKGDDGIVKIKGNTITVSSVIYIYGDGATKESAEFIKKQIMNEWNRKDWKYTDENGKVYNVKFNVSVYLYDGKEKADPSFILGAWDPESRNNYIEVLADPKAKHRSFVRGGDEGKWSYGSIKKLLVAAHEFGHILGLPDRYKDGKDGYSVADKGWESNLMGTLSGKVEQRDINRLVAPAVKYRNSIVSAFKGTEIEKKLMEQCEFTYEINP